MKKVLKLLKGKEIIFVSLLTLIVGGVGGFFIGKGQSNQSQQNNFQEQMQNRFGQNGRSPDTSGATTGGSNSQSGNSGTTQESSDESGTASA